MALSLFSYLNKTNYFYYDNSNYHLVVVVLLVIWGVSLYNNLVKLRNNRENAFANIDVQLKQRQTSYHSSSLPSRIRHARA